MSQPNVLITELDGAVGVLPSSEGQIYALLGASSSGAIDTPSTYARKTDVIAAYGVGPLVEAACYYIDRYALPVVLVRTGHTTTGALGSITHTGTGASVASLHSGAEPKDDYEMYLVVTTGGTVGVAGIQFQWSVDGGRNLSPLVSLGTATTYTLGDTGIQLDFTSATMVAGDTYTARSSAPQWNSTEIGTALDALGNWIGEWDVAHVVGAVDGTFFDAIDLKFAGFQAAGNPKTWMGNTRTPNLAESEATYKTAMDAIFSTRATLFGCVCSGACKMISGVTSRKYRRPVAFVVGAAVAANDAEVDVADPTLGPLAGVSIRDANGNVDEHDESANPGLDDSRFTVLRTWKGKQGVYVNRPRIMSPAGSDFYLTPHRRVMNLAERTIRLFLIDRTSKAVRVDKKTGFILEGEAREIEAGGLAELAAVLLSHPSASDVQFVVNRRDNLLSSGTINCEVRIEPLGYPETFRVKIGFTNPALQTQTT